MNLELLNAIIDESGIKKVFLQEKLGLSYQGLQNKLTGKNDWKRSEIEIICDVLRISTAEEREAVFFTQIVE